MKIVIPGTFDLLHEGHKELFDFAKLMCDDVIITINGDKFSEQLGKKTEQTEEERKRAILNYIDCNVYIVRSEQESLGRTLEASPCFRLTGNDWDIDKTSERCNVPKSFWKDNNVYLIYKDRVPNISSTKLRNEKNSNKT